MVLIGCIVTDKEELGLSSEPPSWQLLHETYRFYLPICLFVCTDTKEHFIWKWDCGTSSSSPWNTSHTSSCEDPLTKTLATQVCNPGSATDLGVHNKNLCDFFFPISIQSELVMQLHLCLQQIWQEPLITWNTPSWKAIFLLSPRHSCSLQRHSRYTLLSLKLKLGIMWVHSLQLWNETALTPKMPQQETSAQWTPRCLFDQEIMISPGEPGTSSHPTAIHWLELSLPVCSAQVKLSLNPLNLHSSETLGSVQGKAVVVNTFHTQGTLEEAEENVQNPHS